MHTIEPGEDTLPWIEPAVRVAAWEVTMGVSVEGLGDWGEAV